MIERTLFDHGRDAIFMIEQPDSMTIKYKDKGVQSMTAKREPLSSQFVYNNVQPDVAMTEKTLN